MNIKTKRVYILTIFATSSILYPSAGNVENKTSRSGLEELIAKLQALSVPKTRTLTPRGRQLNLQELAVILVEPNNSLIANLNSYPEELGENIANYLQDKEKYIRAIEEAAKKGLYSKSKLTEALDRITKIKRGMGGMAMNGISQAILLAESAIGKMSDDN